MDKCPPEIEIELEKIYIIQPITRENAHNYNAIPMRAANSMTAFARIMIGLIEEMEHMTLCELTRQVIKRTGYEADLISKGQVEAERLENLEALCTAVREYEIANENPTLSGFLM